MNMRTLVVGGGIGGLTAALCLARTGHKVIVLERSATFGEVGAGLQISPNASRVLHALGLGGRLAEVGFVPERVDMRHWKSGRLLYSASLGEVSLARFGAPYYHLHRADLLNLLLETAQVQPAIELRRGVEVEGVAEASGVVEVCSQHATEHADLVIGADGIHSTLRASLFGAAEAHFTGNIAWRALVPAERLRQGLVAPAATIWLGPGGHFVHYYVRGGTLVNCVCVVEKRGWEEEGWTSQGDYRELAADFSDWHEDVGCVIDAIDRDSCFKWALFDRDPMPQWSRGRLTLLGDACHPTLPFLAQGAAMAIEDAQVLANCLAVGGDPVPALRRYEMLRRSRTARIQRASRRNGRLYHLPGRAAWARNWVLRRAGNKVMDWLYDYDATGVC